MQSLFGLEESPWSLRGWTALLLFHTYTMYPFFYVLTGAGLSRIDASLAEAGRSLGANRGRVLSRIVLPQIAPSLIAAALLTFMTSMASFSAPVFFGGDARSWISTTLGLTYDQRNCLVVGLAMGFAVIPIIFTIAEDALSPSARGL